jgi:hypothetical protein
MGAISNRPVPIAVEFDSRGKRLTKQFADAATAKGFYAAKLKDGKNPKVKGEHADTVTASAKPKTKAPHAKKVAAAKDKLGCRVGSQSAKINACITSKPKLVAAIAAEAKVESARIRNHLKFLVAKKLVKHTPQGFALN